MTKSQTAVRKGIPNNPTDEHIEAMKLVCEHILEPVREQYGIPFTPCSGYRSGELCIAILYSDRKLSKQSACKGRGGRL